MVSTGALDGAARAAGASPPQAAEPLDGGNYEVIRRRLVERAEELARRAEALNARRKEVFGGTDLALLENARVRTENNCVPRDIVSIRGKLLVGYLVFMGLKEVNVGDVFSLHRFAKDGGAFDLSPAPLDDGDAFLGDPNFIKEFKDLHRYVKEPRLLQLRRSDTRLLAIFQVGATERDTKVFRWSIDATGRVRYLDARGDEDNVRPRAHDFAWTQATRDDHVQESTRTSPSSARSSSRRSAAISRSRSRTTRPRGSASTASRSTTRARRSTTPTSSTPGSGRSSCSRSSRSASPRTATSSTTAAPGRSRASTRSASPA